MPFACSVTSRIVPDFRAGFGTLASQVAGRSQGQSLAPLLMCFVLTSAHAPRRSFRLLVTLLREHFPQSLHHFHLCTGGSLEALVPVVPANLFRYPAGPDNHGGNQVAHKA